jgi:hypothetical protein
MEAALEAAKPTKKQGLSTGRALAVGAALAVVGRVALGPGGSFVRDKVQERLSDGSESEDAEDEDLDEDEEPEAELEQDEEPEAEVEQDEEPAALGPSTTRPRPPIFDRPGPRRSPARPSSRPPRPKGDSDREPKLSAPRRPRRPRAPIGRT